MSQTITHDAARQRYSLILDGVEGYLTYERRQPGVRHITHTIVPPAIGGRGIAGKLVQAAFDLARSSELRRNWGVGPDDPVALNVGRLAAEKS